MFIAPELIKLPVVVKLRLPAKVKLPELVAKLARALTLDWLMIWDAAPVNVMLAALVTIFAPLNCSVPDTAYVPPVRVVPAKLVRLPFTVNFVPVPAVSVPLLVKFAAVVKLRPPARPKFAPAALVAKLARALALAWLTIWEAAPVSVMFAALVMILALSN